MNKGVIFDLDGTIYYGNTIVKGAIETISELQKFGYEIIFFTNNSTKKRSEIFKKLISLGINTELNRVYTSSFATGVYLKSNAIDKVFLIGTKEFKEELSDFGIHIVEETKAQAVIVGLDVNFDYEKLSKSLIAVNNGAKIIVCNKDKNFPIENGVKKPGCNAMVSALLGSCDSGIDVDYIIGKPNTYLLEIICKDWNLDKKLIYVVGDSLESDIAMADNYGVKSILVGSSVNYGLEEVITIIKGEDDECIRI